MVKGDISVVENSRGKRLYIIVLCLVKFIPILVSGIFLLNTVLSYCDIDIPLLSYIVALTFVILLYLLSYIFKFCKWHRMFIHYITINWILNIIDYYIGIPLSDKGMLVLYLCITIVCLFIIVYCKFGKKRKKEERE